MADNPLLVRLLLRDEKKTYGLGVSDQELLTLDSNEDSETLNFIQLKANLERSSGAERHERLNNSTIKEYLSHHITLIVIKRSWR